jgi:hypothetical protein
LILMDVNASAVPEALDGLHEPRAGESRNIEVRAARK